MPIGTRDEIIDKLIEDELEDYCEREPYDYWKWVEEVLLNGWKGFTEMTDEELEACLGPAARAWFEAKRE